MLPDLFPRFRKRVEIPNRGKRLHIKSEPRDVARSARRKRMFFLDGREFTV